MASSSSLTALVQKSFKYDVFLSFRGEDTRKSFVDHLYHALDDKGIITYKDDEKIEKGERIDDQLMRSIEESRFYIIVFSKNYASSSWCLDELVKIMECQKMPEHTAYPIFYDVEPTEVRNQRDSVGEAFAKCEKEESTRKRKRTLEDEDLEKVDDVGRWRNALKEAASLAGMELKNTFNGHEAKFIQQIVQQISLKLRFINFPVDGKLVGMETRVMNVLSSLEIGSEDARVIGIKGMGGGGKTTLARAVFDHISTWFEGKIFIENVREGSKGSGLKKLQKQILSAVLNDKSIDLTSVSQGKDILKMRMRNRKVLVVLDDVDNIEQLEALAGDLTWFKPGSRIIITSRDEQVLVAHGVNSDDIHDVNLLTHEEAICLFGKYAFKRDIPNQEYEDLCGKVVNYAAGLPLTIKVLGSHLCGRSEYEWVDAIERLKTIPLKETLKRLEISYDGLEDDQKEIFLDVVCILKGKLIDEAIRVLEIFGFNARIGLKVLEQKSLITISDDICDDKYLGMHDHVEEMGKNIVRRLHPNEPSRHSRLWIRKEIEDILVNELGTEATRSIKLNGEVLHPAIIMKGLRKMRKLRYLYVFNHKVFKYDDESASSSSSSSDNDDDTYLDISHYLPDDLRYLYWRSYPFCWLSKTMQANVRERKVLKNLRFLNLNHSNLRTFDLGLTPDLEELNLEGCFHFVKLHLPFRCSNLKSINLSGTKVSYLNIGLTPHLVDLNLRGCYHFVELHLPFECSNLKSINLSGTKVSYLNIGLIPHLVELNLKGCYHFVKLHLPFECSNLKSINLSGTKVSYLNLGMTPHLEWLNLVHCYSLQEIDAPVGCLKNLYFLDLRGCLRFQNYFVVDGEYKSGATLTIAAEFQDECPLHPSSKLPKFQFRCEYRGCLPSSSGNLEKLISFGLCACTNLESFSANICGLQQLKKLTFTGSIPELPKYLHQLESLEELNLWIEEIKHLPDSICMLKHLKSLKLKACEHLEQLPENIYRLECLEELTLKNCRSLRDFPNINDSMQCLKRVHLSDCSRIEKLPEEIGRLECLEELSLRGCNSLRDIPNNICNMKCLKSLRLSDCILVEKLPEELGRLECLEDLDLIGCESLRDIPKSICNMKCLESLHLSDCILVEKLPEELGRLECLKVLDIENAGISCLPQSIIQLKGLTIYGSREQLWFLRHR